MALQRELVEEKFLEFLRKKHPSFPTKEQAEIRCEEMKRNAQKPGYPFQEACSELTDWRSWIKLFYFDLVTVVDLLLKCHERKLDPRRDAGELFKKERLAPLISVGPFSVFREPEIKSVFREPDGKSAFLEKLFESFVETLKWMRLEHALEGQSAAGTESKSIASSRLELNEGQQGFRIDSAWYPLNGVKAVHFLSALLRGRGEWVSGKDLDDPKVKQARADKIRGTLPKPIQKIIATRRGGRGGYRIKPEFFE